jgi:hypothetical protein
MSRALRLALPCALLGTTFGGPASAQTTVAAPAGQSGEQLVHVTEAEIDTAETQAKVNSEANAEEITREVFGTGGPAFDAIGVTSQTITSIEGLKRIAAGIVTGTDEDGESLQGVGIQFSPAQLFRGLQVDHNTYKTDYLARFLARLQVNAAYARAETDNAGKPERAAIGGTAILFDDTDPFANKPLDDCIATAIAKLRIDRNYTGNPTQIGVVVDESRPTEIEPISQCRKTHGRTPTSGSVGQIGFAKLFRNSAGASGSLEGHGFAANAIVSIGLDCVFSTECRETAQPGQEDKPRIGGKLLLGAVFRDRELVVNPLDDTQFVDRDRLSLGGRLLVGDPARFWLGVELLHQRAKYDGGLGRDNYTTYSVSADLKLTDGQWLTVGYGDSRGSNFSRGAQFTAGFKYALQPKPRLGD